MTTRPGIDAEAARYVERIVHTLRRTLDGEFYAAHLTGSLALGDYLSGTSDVDVLAVCTEPLRAETKRRLVEALSHPTLPCPTRGLELVLYTGASLQRPSRSPAFEFNLNTGPGMDDRASFDPSSEPSHWFLLDLAIARQHAIPLVGPPPTDTIAPIPLRWVLSAVARSLDWHLEHEPAGANTVLNACRSWRFAEEGVWTSKSEAAAWARDRINDRSLIATALATRHGRHTPTLEEPTVRGFVLAIRSRVVELSDGAAAAPP